MKSLVAYAYEFLKFCELILLQICLQNMGIWVANMLAKLKTEESIKKKTQFGILEYHITVANKLFSL